MDRILSALMLGVFIFLASFQIDIDVIVNLDESIVKEVVDG